ncbi:MAG: cation transporter [Bacteroidales bacterium]
MYRILILLITVMMIDSCSSNPKTDHTAEGENTQTPAAEWVEVVLEVDGMTCEGCENAIKAGVEDLEGIEAVESSHQEGWTRVRYDRNLTSREQIEEKITETGYTVKGEKTGP